MSTNYPPGVSGNEPEIIGADDDVTVPAALPPIRKGAMCRTCKVWKVQAEMNMRQKECRQCINARADAYGRQRRLEVEELDAPAPWESIDGQLSLIGPNDARVDGEQLTLW